MLDTQHAETMRHALTTLCLSVDTVRSDKEAVFFDYNSATDPERPTS